jgi:hypothetical protein
MSDRVNDDLTDRELEEIEGWADGGSYMLRLVAEVRRSRARIAKMADALHTLERWDMLTLDHDGHGVATADAPWARRLIAGALDD